MRRRSLVLVTLALLAGGCPTTPGNNLPDMSPRPFDVNVTAAAPSDEAKRTAGTQTDGSVILPGGRRISPAGRLLDVGGFPISMRVLPGDRYVVLTDCGYGDERIALVDLQSAAMSPVISQVDYPKVKSSSKDPALFYGLALTKDGKRLYVSTGGYDPVDDAELGIKHYNPIDAIDIAGAPPTLTKNDAAGIKLFFNPGAATNGSAVARLPSGLTLSSDEKLLYVATQMDGSLAIVDLVVGLGYGAEIGRAMLPGVGPYDVAVHEPTHTAFVSLWGGKKIGTDKFVDGVAVVDVTDPMKPLAMQALLPTGKGSEAELLLDNKLYVANADADTVSIYDVVSKKYEERSTGMAGLVGSAPNHLAVDPVARRLYAASAGENAVEVWSTDTLAKLGRVPTAQYPTAVAVLSDGTLLVASGKGMGLGRTDMPNNHYQQGVLQVVNKPTDAELTAGDKIVADNLTRPLSYQVALTPPATGEKRFPLPPEKGAPTPIEHVFLLVRENKTYDAVLGDLAGANGMPSLAQFGGDMTPNLHALAKAFTNLDNFYSNADQSIQGHEWTTAGVANDYTEKAWFATWGRAYRPLAAFASGPFEHLAHPGSDTIWTHLDKGNLAYHNYGEIVNTSGAARIYDTSYPGIFFDLSHPDVQKIQYVIDQLNDETFALEPFSYISLPNDHTYGTTPGKPTVQSMIADNDEATGRFIDALSHSRWWATSIVFLIEDDPSDGADHVEGHRSPCLVISPWSKRGHVSSVNYDNPSLMKTMMLLLGLDPLNLHDATSAGMYDVFASKPDYTPYTVIPRKIPIATNSDDAPMAEESRKIFGDKNRPIDGAPLGRILWKAIHGKDTEPPWGATASPRAHRAPDDDD